MSVNGLIQAAQELSDSVTGLLAQAAANPGLMRPAVLAYNPLDYAFALHERYIRSYGAGKKRALFLGMNPGPFGMAQTGVPFGEVAAVHEWLKLSGDIGRPGVMHPKRPIDGFDCRRSEVSGRRFWGLMQSRFGEAKTFFAQAWVDNYCPLIFMNESGGNITPDKLPRAFQDSLYTACDTHLRAVIVEVQPDYCIGIGAFAAKRFEKVLPPSTSIKTGVIIHPSPANPAANRDWAGLATAQLLQQGVWE
jgi:single-strand selective monofunctional uracil DNA glycosylase